MLTSTRFAPLLFTLFVAAAGSAAGCATPSPLVRLEPRTPDRAVWASGRAVLEKEKDGVRVAVAFEHQQDSGLGIRVEIENGTAAPFEVGPEGITFMTCTTLDNATCDGSWGVVDPEQVLDGLDEQQSRREAEATNDARFHTTLVLLSAATDVATIASGHADETTGLTTVAAAEHGEASAASASRDLGSIEGQRDLWSNVALRRNTLAPGHGISGIVYLPINFSTQYIWLHVRAGGQVFPFGFKQTVKRVHYGG
jgi:hypothetical protein